MFALIQRFGNTVLDHLSVCFFQFVKYPYDIYKCYSNVLCCTILTHFCCLFLHSVQEHVNRAGLGLLQSKSGGSDDRQFREKVQRLIQDYANGNSQYDLVFSPEFTIEERKTMHK
jgi:hypothetical protein